MWNHRKKKKTIVTGILLLVLLAVGLRGLRIQSVSDYEKEREEVSLHLGLVTPSPTGAVSQKENQAVSSGQKAAKQKNHADKKQASQESHKTAASLQKKDAKTTKKTASSPEKKQKKKDFSEKSSKTSEKKSQLPVPSSEGDSEGGSDTASQASPEETGANAAEGNFAEETQTASDGGQEPVPTTTGEKQKITCFLEIRCDQLAENKGKADKSIWDYIPEDGILFKKTEVRVEEGTTAYGLLSLVCQSEKIALDAKYTPMYRSYYVSGIGNLYEKQAGSMSGWIYKVNGKSPNKGASSFRLSQGDECVWSYTCDGKTE
jgi:hypothetical protein